MAVQNIGSKLQVYRGTAKQTSGGLKKKDILRIKQKDGSSKYVAKSRHEHGKKMYKLVKNVLKNYQYKKKKSTKNNSNNNKNNSNNKKSRKKFLGLF